MILDTMKPYEQELVTKGFDGMSVIHQNDLISRLANNFGLCYFNVESSMILDVHKSLKLKLIEEGYTQSINAGYFHMDNGHLYPMGTEDQADFNSVRLLVTDKPQEKVNWFTEDSGEVEHPLEEWVAVFNGLAAHKQELNHKFNSTCASVTDATSHEALLAINWVV